jgi:hypothetical protein
MTSSTSGRPAAPASHRAPGPAAPASATDTQLSAWMAEEYGQHFTAPAGDGGLDIEEVLGDIACALDDHDATHPARTLTIWPVPDHPEGVLITAGRPQQGQLCVLTAFRRSFGATMQQALGEFLRAARTATALLDAAATDGAAPPGHFVPENGTVLTYDPATVAAGSLDDAVHDVFSRQASTVNNEGPLAQMACLIGELGPAAAQQEITAPA